MCVLHLTLSCAAIAYALINPTSVLQDYCENDSFQAECPHGNIVIIEEARYGRMELGTCILADFGYLNCFR